MAEQSLSVSESLEPNSTGAHVETTCPPLNEERVELDLNLMGCRPFMERSNYYCDSCPGQEGLIQSQRMPGPRINPMGYRAHEIPMEPPIPNAHGVWWLPGVPPPDRGQTYHFPHPQRDLPEE